MYTLFDFDTSTFYVGDYMIHDMDMLLVGKRKDRHILFISSRVEKSLKIYKLGVYQKYETGSSVNNRFVIVTPLFNECILRLEQEESTTATTHVLDFKSRGFR